MTTKLGPGGFPVTSLLDETTQGGEVADVIGGHIPGRHRPGRHQPVLHEPGEVGTPAPIAAAGGAHRVTTKSVDFETLVLSLRPASQQQVPSYQFSNGRTFVQPEDREI